MYNRIIIKGYQVPVMGYQVPVIRLYIRGTGTVTVNVKSYLTGSGTKTVTVKITNPVLEL
jgi:hypothetical protein